MLQETLQAVADAISTALPDVQVKPYQLSNPTPPAADIFPAEIDYDKAMARGMDTWTFTLRVFVGETSDIGAQARLYKMIEPSGPQSIKQAVEADVTLGGVVFDVHVQSFDGLRRFQGEGTGPLLGGVWTVVVRADGG